MSLSQRAASGNTPDMKRAGVIANPRRPHADDVFERLARWAQENRIELLADQRTASFLPGARIIGYDQFPGAVDVLLALGGDGTVLFCARMLDGAPIPILGINLGGLGFLTAVGEERLEEAVNALASGLCERDERAVADVTVVRNGAESEHFRTLNDVVLGFGGSSRMVSLDLIVDGHPGATFGCDGMIVSTPTGSTGHALSAGGPIIDPHAAVFGISVICPHTLSNRPIIVPDRCPIEIHVRRARKDLLLSADGQDVGFLAEGDALRITRSTQPVCFLHPPGYRYFSILGQKLHWRGQMTEARPDDDPPAAQ